jgi:hypothetical protein
MPAKGKISVAPMKKNPIPKVKQSKPKNPKKIIFSSNVEELFGFIFIKE